MAESPNKMFISDPSDHPITDSNGNVWRVTQTKRLSANGVLDPDDSPALLVVYANQLIWRQRPDLLWQAKKHPSDPWLPTEGRSDPPLGDWTGRGVSESERGMRQILQAIAAFRADFDANHGSGAGSISPAGATQIQATLAALQAQLAGLQAQTGAYVTQILEAIQAADRHVGDAAAALTLLLNEILATLQASAVPTGIALDLDHATHQPQAIPSAHGP